MAGLSGLDDAELRDAILSFWEGNNLELMIYIEDHGLPNTPEMCNVIQHLLAVHREKESADQRISRRLSMLAVSLTMERATAERDHPPQLSARNMGISRAYEYAARAEGMSAESIERWAKGNAEAQEVIATHRALVKKILARRMPKRMR